MSPKRIIALTLIFAGLGVISALAFVRYTRAKEPTAGLKVETAPASTVFVDNEQIGLSPLEKFFRPGEVTVKLIPESTSSAMSTYQTKVRLTDKVYTVIRRDFGPTDGQSAGDIISLQNQSEKSAGLNVISSVPESASVVLDGQPQGFTPLSVPSVGPGDHQIVVSAPGYLPRTISARAESGYRLTVNVKLAQNLAAQVSPSPLLIATTSATPSALARPSLTASGTPKPTPRISPSPTGKSGTPTPAPSIAKPYVKISSTPVGFLRVRSGPSTGNAEIGRVSPGDTYPLLGSQPGWYQIKGTFGSADSGWISAQYAQKIE